MKPGRRALGFAESYRTDRSTLAGAVVRADRTFDGAVFGTCTVGGTDITDAILEMYTRLDREDIAYLLISGIALAWFNIVDLHELHRTLDRPVVGVTYEHGEPLRERLAEHFDGMEREHRVSILEAQPDRIPINVNDHRLWLRPVGMAPDEAVAVVDRYTPAGGRPEPLRVARTLARAADEWAQP